MWLTDGQKIGVGLTAFGMFFTICGVFMFFDAGLLAIGNILFLSGLVLVIGAQKTLGFFARKNKLKGTICFVTGIILVFIKWPIIGMLVESFGFLNLFGDFFPVVLSFLRRVPFIGPFLNHPIFTKIAYMFGGGQRTSPV